MALNLEKMDSEMNGECSKDYDLDHLLMRPSSFADESFEPSEEVYNHFNNV
jgi:hypothetical protein